MATDFTMYAGDHKTLRISVLDGDGDAASLVGVTALRWQLALGYNRNILISKSLGDGVTVTDAAGGIFTVDLVRADTEALKGNYVHEAEVVDADGDIATVIFGRATIKGTVIKPA